MGLSVPIFIYILPGKVSDLDIITEARDNLRLEFEDVRKQRLDTFMAGFGIITMKLKEMYQVKFFETIKELFAIIVI